MNQPTTQHTGGPWKVEGTSRVGEARITAPFKPSCNYLVALASPDAPDDATRDANARLIAASPDLLEACRTLVQLIDVQDHDVATVTIKVSDLVPFVRTARAAIAKATGQNC